MNAKKKFYFTIITIEITDFIERILEKACVKIIFLLSTSFRYLTASSMGGSMTTIPPGRSDTTPILNPIPEAREEKETSQPKVPPAAVDPYDLDVEVKSLPSENTTGLGPSTTCESECGKTAIKTCGYSCIGTCGYSQCGC